MASKKKQTADEQIINATMQGVGYAYRQSERNRAFAALAMMKQLEYKFMEMHAWGRATRETESVSNGTRTAYTRKH